MSHTSDALSIWKVGEHLTGSQIARRVRATGARAQAQSISSRIAKSAAKGIFEKEVIKVKGISMYSYYPADKEILAEHGLVWRARDG